MRGLPSLHGKPGFKVRHVPLGASEMRRSYFGAQRGFTGSRFPSLDSRLLASKFCYHSRLNTIFPKCFPASS